jgi:hypothetical protein
VIQLDRYFQVNKDGQGDSLRDSSASPTNKVFFSKQKGKIMKGFSILSLMASLAIVVAGGFAPIPAIAEPDPAFKPIIGEIRNKLPSNLVFRLPSLLPRPVTREMSPKLTFDANSERAHLDLEDENCPPRFNKKGSRAYELVCRLFSVTASTLTSTYYQRNQIKPGSRTTVVQLSRNLRGYHLQGLDWSKVSWIQDNIYFQIYSAVPADKLIEVARSMVANSQVISGRSATVGQPKTQLMTEEPITRILRSQRRIEQKN